MKKTLFKDIETSSDGSDISLHDDSSDISLEDIENGNDAHVNDIVIPTMNSDVAEGSFVLTKFETKKENCLFLHWPNFRDIS